MDVIAALCAAFVLLLAVGLGVTLRARARINERLEAALEEQKRLAVSDGLTGLHNQRFLDEVLKLEIERARRHERSVSILLLDLDGFGAVNRAHGRAAGDRVLVDVATRLRRSVRSSDVLARNGADKFTAVLADAESETVLEVAERCRAAVASTPFTLTGQDMEITISAGAACLPQHAQSLGELIDAGERAIAAAKVQGGDAVRMADEAGAPDEGLPALDAVGVVTYLESVADDVDQRQDVEGHSLACAAWAGRVADALGLDEAVRWRCVAAARFHDVGKVTVPNAILAKAGRLTEEEWRRVREHPAQGARLVELAPTLSDVAPVIGEHHERPDGSGFPKGKIGGEISIEARVVAVCDAWAAMRADRPYRDALSADEARAELLAGSGTQFDSGVVGVFLALPEVRRRDVGAAPSGAESAPVVVRRPVG